MEVIAYEMKYFENNLAKTDIHCIPFEQRLFPQYMQIYNECFYEMRKALNIEPYDFLQNYQQIAEKAKDIYLLMEYEQIVGSVACYGNEIDDLIVSRKFQHKGYGKQLLLWGMQHIRQSNSNPITLHVAEWNKEALKLYKSVGFEITNIETIR